MASRRSDSKITSTIGWRTPWLRRVLQFVCKQLEYPYANLALARFSLCHNAVYHGVAYFERHTVRVKIDPLNYYPLPGAHCTALPRLLFTDAVEVLVLITAHEVAHLERWDRFARGMRRNGQRDTRLELETEQLARQVLETFRGRREELLVAWGDAGPGPRAKEVHRLRCRRCGHVWEHARRPSNATRRSCGTCWPKWQDAAAAGEFLEYSKVS